MRTIRALAILAIVAGTVAGNGVARATPMEPEGMFDCKAFGYRISIPGHWQSSGCSIRTTYDSFRRSGRITIIVTPPHAQTVAAMHAAEAKDLHALGQPPIKSYLSFAGSSAAWVTAHAEYRGTDADGNDVFGSADEYRHTGKAHNFVVLATDLDSSHDTEGAGQEISQALSSIEIYGEGATDFNPTVNVSPNPVPYDGIATVTVHAPKGTHCFGGIYYEDGSYARNFAPNQIDVPASGVYVWHWHVVTETHAGSADITCSYKGRARRLPTAFSVSG